MIKFRHFRYDDTDGVNRLLSEYVIANGVPVFRNEEHLVIPYEDGSEYTLEQRIVSLREIRSKKIQELDLLMYAQSVLDMQIAKVTRIMEQVGEESARELAELDARLVTSEGMTKGTYDANKTVEDRIKQVKEETKKRLANLQNVLDQKRQQFEMNTAEAIDKSDNIEVAGVCIEKLGSGKAETADYDAPVTSTTFQAVSEDGTIAVRGNTQEEADARLANEMKFRDEEADSKKQEDK